MSEPRQIPLPIDGASPARPLILSASRRTDLPGFYPDRLAERVRGRLEHLGAPLFGLVIWTRYPEALLREPLRSLLEDDVVNTALNLTVTGLGGSRLEPRVPATRRVLEVVPEVIDLLGGRPERVRWRFDPLLFGRMSLGLFDDLAGRMGALGVPTVTISFPSAMSLKGPLGPSYAAAGIAPWPGLKAKVAFASELVARAGGHGMRVLACCEPKILRDVGGIEAAQCVPLEVLEPLDPARRVFPRSKDRTQRKHCACPPSVDIGDYSTDLCGSGCAYCYSRAGGQHVDWSCAKGR